MSAPNPPQRLTINANKCAKLHAPLAAGKCEEIFGAANYIDLGERAVKRPLGLRLRGREYTRF